MQSYNSIYEKLNNYADSIKIIDTHEHLHPVNTFTGDTPDVLSDYFSHYISSDLYSAGMNETDLTKVRDASFDINERFRILEPRLNQVKNTSYYRSLKISAKRIHEIDDISADTIEELNEKFKKAATQKDYGRYIMKDICNIDVSINDNWSNDMKLSTTELFAPAWQPVDYLNYTSKDSDIIPKSEKIQIDNISLDEFCGHYKKHFLKQIKDGMKTLKFPVAYWRSLYFEDVSFDDAAKIFDEVKKSKEPFPKKLQDFMMHYMLKITDENGFIAQIHTGLQEGMHHNLEDSNPMLLKNLFTKYPNMTFDLFHTAYPYERELTVLAKTHANVYVDFCWSHLISPFAAKNAFYEMLDVIPYTKIFGFGGDYIFFDAVYGHLTLAKQNICTVLSKKVENNECDLDFAKEILHAVLYSNAKRMFKI